MSGFVTLDDAVRGAVHDGRTPLLDGVFGLITHLGDTWAIIAFTIMLVYVVARAGRARQARAIAIAIAVGAVPLVQGIKYVIGRVRPPAADALIELPASASWPSGHAFAALLLALLAAWFMWARREERPWLRAALSGGALLLALLVGVSRVYLGVHWATDVLAGWVLAVVWFAAVVTLATRRDPT